MNTIIDEVISITKIKCDSKRYDITVEDNHNFFANDILVHNCQNLANEWDELKKIDPWFVTEKLDGTSFTAYIKGDTFGVCSRNLELRENDSNTYWKVAKENDLETKMRKLRHEHGNVDFAIQSEILGEGIQKNKYNLKGQKMFVFNVYNITDCKFFGWGAVSDICKELGIETVPVLGEHLHFEPDDTIDSILKFAEGTSLLNPNTEREGVVFKTYAREKSFKAISNKFLLKGGE
jgi:RNA ligase (TIGR02306 family)